MVVYKCQKHGDLEIENVIKSGLRKNGSQIYRCSKCYKQTRKNNYLRKKDHILERSRKWKKENPERLRFLNSRSRKKIASIKKGIEKKGIEKKENIKDKYEKFSSKKIRAIRRLRYILFDINRMMG